MSLDITLMLGTQATKKSYFPVWDETTGAVVEEDPGSRSLGVVPRIDGICVFDDNITHNLAKMANEAGLYEVMWHPPSTRAGDLIEALRAGLARLNAQPKVYAKLNPSNGWGNIDNLRTTAANYLAACEAWPDAQVYVSR